LRVDNQKVNKKVIESLIKSGSMDNFGYRSAMLQGLDKVRETGNIINKIKNTGQKSLFGETTKSDVVDALPNVEEFNKTLKLEMEKEHLGFYLTEHPHAHKLSLIGNFITHRIADLYLENLSQQTVTTGGIIESVRVITTKNTNQQMAFVKLSDLGKNIEAIVFPKTYSSTTPVWKQDNLIILRGKLEYGQTREIDEAGEVLREITMIVSSATEFDGPDTVLPEINSNNNLQFPKKTNSSMISIYIPPGTTQSQMLKINELLQSHKGSHSCELVFANNGSSRVIPLAFNLNWSEELKSQIDKILKIR
jgi:DNA polymerase III alpha subunit